MNIFNSTNNGGGRPTDWNRKSQAGCQRKLNFNWSAETGKLPDLGMSPPGKQFGGGQRSSLCAPNNRLLRPSDLPMDWREKKKSVARRHLIGSLSAPMKSSGVARVSGIGQSLTSPDALHSKTAEGYSNRNVEEGNLQGVDKMENIFQKRLNLKLKKPEPYKNANAHAHLVSSGSHLNSKSTLHKPLVWTSDVALISDIKDMISDNSTDGGSAKETAEQVGSNHRSKNERVDWRHYRPLTPNLLKKLNNMKLSTYVKTQHWVNQIPPGASWASRHVSTPTTCTETSWGNLKNGAQGKPHRSWIYGNGR